MKKIIAVGSYGFANVKLFCVGDEQGIEDLESYINWRKTGRIDLNGLMNRIIHNHIYVCPMSKKLRDKLFCVKIKKKLKKNNLYINFDSYLEAACIVKPDYVKELLDLTDEEVKDVVDNTNWKKHFS